MNDREFCDYMKRHRDIYQRIRRGEDGIWELPVKHGDIEPYGDDTLCCYQSFKNGRGVQALKRKLPGYCTVTQEARAEMVFKFPMDRIHEIAALVGAIRRRVVSPEERARLMELSKATRFKKHGAAMAHKGAGIAVSA